MQSSTQLILGGARSGKSRYAQQLAESLPGDLVYFATAEAGDAEMETRIARHIEDRGDAWRTVEAPLDLAEAIQSHNTPGCVLLVDCLTLWLSNLMHANADVAAATHKLANAVTASNATPILVSNEVGLGIVPENALARLFRDEQGRLNQLIAKACEKVVFIAAGLPLTLKG